MTKKLQVVRPFVLDEGEQIFGQSATTASARSQFDEPPRGSGKTRYGPWRQD
jgi:hypothetical protein